MCGFKLATHCNTEYLVNRRNCLYDITIEFHRTYLCLNNCVARSLPQRAENSHEESADQTVMMFTIFICRIVLMKRDPNSISHCFHRLIITLNCNQFSYKFSCPIKNFLFTVLLHFIKYLLSYKWYNSVWLDCILKLTVLYNNDRKKMSMAS